MAAAKHLQYDPILVQELGRAQSPEDVLPVWLRHRQPLRKCRMILSCPGSGHVGIPARHDFHGNGFLRSLFAHDYLMFFDDAVIDDMGSWGVSRIPIGYTVSFDLNAVSYVAALVKGRNAPVLKSMLEAMQHITRLQFNYDASLYFWENAGDPMTEEKTAKVRETLIAWETFKSIDSARLLGKGEIVAVLTDREIADSADSILTGYLRFLKSDVSVKAFRVQRTVYPILLKAALIHFEAGSMPPARKVQALLEFMHSDMGCMFLRELVLGCHFLVNGPGRCPFFSRVQPNNAEILMTLSNMAWDITAMHMMERYPEDLPRDRRRYFLTYLLTFDRGLADLFDIYPLRSMIYVDGVDGPMGFPTFEPEEYLRRECGVSGDTLARYFSLDAVACRRSRGQAGRADPGLLTAGIENRLIGLLKPRVPQKRASCGPH